MEPSTASPPGWFADPWDPSVWRYWDGEAWTVHTSGVGRRVVEAAKPHVERRWIHAMTGLGLAGVLAVVWGAFRINAYPWTAECGTEERNDQIWDTILAAMPPYGVLVILAMLGTIVFQRGARGRSGLGHKFIVVALTAGWVAVVTLNPLLLFFSDLGNCGQ